MRALDTFLQLGRRPNEAQPWLVAHCDLLPLFDCEHDCNHIIRAKLTVAPSQATIHVETKEQTPI